jgi:hypothetical protein
VCALVMGPMDINREEHKTFLNVVNYTRETTGFI